MTVAYLQTTAADAGVGTLSLMVALGVGIAVAIIAVVAFLHMTSRSLRGNGGAAEWKVREDAVPDERPRAGESPEAGGKRFSDEEDPALTDTIELPLRRGGSPEPETPGDRGPDAAEPAGELEPRLCGLEGEHKGSSYRMRGKQLSIGRDPAQCGILFPFGRLEISRLHCTLSFVESSGLFLIEDHGSSNGTFLSSGERLQPGKVYELRDGERFSLSGSRIWFEVRE